MTREHLSVIAATARYKLEILKGVFAKSELNIEQKAFGTNYGLTAKVRKDTFNLTKGIPKEHVADNASGVLIHREFCQNCGSFILEYGWDSNKEINQDAAKDYFRYICVGSLDDPEALPPKGEFFCKARASWMPEIPNVFHKQAINE
ncbi:unnamed protein product [Penicillium glandicola]